MQYSEETVLGRKFKFNDPFLLHSNSFVPGNWYDALEFALYISIHHPEYTQAITRTVAHFITDIACTEEGDYAEKVDFKDYLIDDLGVMEALRQAGVEMFVYGNSFVRIHYPFTRYLVDRRGGGYRLYDVSLYKDVAKFNINDLTYTIPDPAVDHSNPENKGKTESFEFIDRTSKDRSKIRIRFLDPKRMMLSMNFISGSIEYIYRFEEFFTAAVRGGQNIQQINETPREMLEAIRDNKDFKFEQGNIFHFKNPYISGLSNNGWGIPNILLNYSSIHQIQVLRCVNEAVGRDYLLPIRLLSPSQSIAGGGGDIMGAASLAMWKSSMANIIANKRKVPDMLFTVPFPVNYQEAGGSGKNLAPVDLLQSAKDNLLEDTGIPAELYRMSLTAQQVPTALRLFESTFVYLPRSFNNFVKWVAQEICDYLHQPRLKVKLLRPSIADDLEKRNVYLSLASGGEISRATAYRTFNIDDPVGEQERRADEDAEIAIMKEKKNQEMERRMQLGSGDQVVGAMAEAAAQQQGPPPGGGGGGAPGGAPAGMQGPSGANVTPLDIEQQAEEQAQQLLQLPVGERQKAMRNLQATNPNLHAMTKQKMAEMRSQAESQGRAQLSAPQ